MKCQIIRNHLVETLNLGFPRIIRHFLSLTGHFFLARFRGLRIVNPEYPPDGLVLYIPKSGKAHSSRVATRQIPAC